jgi:hypothetical protein
MGHDSRERKKEQLEGAAARLARPLKAAAQT